MDQDDFKQLVKEYVRIQEVLGVKSVELRELRRKRNAYEARIVEFMRRNDISTCTLPNGLLYVQNKETKKPPPKSDLENRLVGAVGQDTAAQALEIFYNARAVSTKSVLRHISAPTG